ncbi:MAG: hypothetical protein KC431_06465 [Myxococcales bacterium]|nr:hypothetical protein [Myxococcales bacterium]
MPDPIGDELWRIEGAWALPGCTRPHLYRDGRQLQLQCFDTNDNFSWENLGSLTAEAAEQLDMAIAAADFEDTTTVNYKGFCGAADSVGTETLWVGDRSVSFATSCPFAGVLAVYEVIDTVSIELSECRDPAMGLATMLATIEPGCRAY